MIEIGINSEILKQILDGRKTVEGRLAKGKFTALQIGDIISLREDIYKDGSIVESRSGVSKIEVNGIMKFASFRDMLNYYGYQSVIPDAESVEDAIREYGKYYSLADEKAYGVLGISFRLRSS